MTVKPENLPAHVKSLYRLRPDRRFLYAAAELQRLSTGGPRRGTMAIRFEESRWHLSLDGSSFGDLPEFPTFADARNLLGSRLRAQPGRPRSSSGADALGATDRAALENGLPAEVFSVFARLNTAWIGSPGDPALAETSLRGLLWLALQTFDELELTDPILGKALALLAIADAREPGHLAREESLLACLFGYEDHAKLAARGLPANDPVRLYAIWDVVGLKALAHRPHPEPRAEYLYLLRLAENHREDDWFSEFEASSWGVQVDVPSLRLVLALDPFSWRSTQTTLMESQILEDLSAASHGAGGVLSAKGNATWREIARQRLEALERSGQKPPVGRLSTLEETVNSEASRLDSPLLDRSVVRAFHFANFYSSVYSTARYDFDTFGSTEVAESFGNSLISPPAGTASELKDWILHRVEVRRSPAEGVKAVAADLSRLRRIGMAPLNRISTSVAISVTSGIDLTRRAPVRSYFDRLDSRPSNLHAAGRTAVDLLDDPAIEEKCFRLAVDRGPRAVGWQLPWILRFLGDRDALRALAKDKTWSVASRSSALQELAGLEKTEPRILVEQFRELFREDPATSGVVQAAIGVLEGQDQIESALRLIDEWLDKHVERDLDWAAVVSLKSHLLRRRGRFKEAWDVAKSAAETWKEDCLWEAALALIDLGRLNDALTMARNAFDRYGDDSSAILVAKILWMKGRDDEAGQVLTKPGRQLTRLVWTWELPLAFNEAFQKASDDRAEAAFLKLVMPGVPTSNLFWFVDYLTKHGRAGLAVRLCGHLHGRGPAGWAAVPTYRAMREAQGAVAARDWLRANATPADLDMSPKEAFQDGDYELIWDLPDHPDPTKNEILYVIRAACLLYQPKGPPGRRNQLLTFFQSRPKKDFVAYGLYLLGRLDRAALFAQIKDLSYVSSIGWILGLSSAHEGRYEEANAWLQVCMEVGANYPSRYFAFAVLSRWSKARSSLAELARKQIY